MVEPTLEMTYTSGVHIQVLENSKSAQKSGSPTDATAPERGCVLIFHIAQDLEMPLIVSVHIHVWVYLCVCVPVCVKERTLWDLGVY